MSYKIGKPAKPVDLRKVNAENAKRDKALEKSQKQLARTPNSGLGHPLNSKPHNRTVEDYAQQPKPKRFHRTLSEYRKKGVNGLV